MQGLSEPIDAWRACGRKVNVERGIWGAGELGSGGEALRFEHRSDANNQNGSLMRLANPTVEILQGEQLGHSVWSPYRGGR